MAEGKNECVGRLAVVGERRLVWVCVQGLFGALTVTMKLQPAIVTLHLLGGIGLLALLTWIALREAPAVTPAVAPRVHSAAVAALGVVFVQIGLGVGLAVTTR